MVVTLKTTTAHIHPQSSSKNLSSLNLKVIKYNLAGIQPECQLWLQEWILNKILPIEHFLIVDFFNIIIFSLFNDNNFLFFFRILYFSSTTGRRLATTS